MEEDPESVRDVATSLLKLYSQIEKGCFDEYDALKTMNEKMKGLVIK